MYTWKGLHPVGYIKYVITYIEIKSIKPKGKDFTSNGTVAIANQAKSPSDYSKWGATGIIQPDETVLWNIFCIDPATNCREASGEATFTAASDINDDIRTFIRKHILQALLQNKVHQ